MLFTFAGGTGHFLPLVLFARAAEAAGHVVAFGAQAGVVTTVEEAGFSAFNTGGPTLLVASERTPLLELDMAREERAVRDGYAGRTARERAANVLLLCETWHPDLLVCDEMTSPAATERPRHPAGRGRPRRRVLAVGACVAVARLLHARNDLQPRIGRRLRAGPGAAARAAGRRRRHGWARARSVCTRRSATECARLQLHSAVTPAPALQPLCVARGLGQRRRRAAHGVPMVLLPMGADQPLNAARCAELRVARVLNALEATPQDVQDAATAVLADASYARTAERLEAEIAALPGPEYSLRLLERIAA